MQSAKKLMISVTLLFLVLAPVANADLILNPTDDTWIDANGPDLNKNGSVLLVEYSNPGFGKPRSAYLRFDLTGISRDLGPGTKLRVYVTAGADLTVGTVALWSTGDDWNGAVAGNGGETTLTWNNAPAGITKLDTKTAAATGSWIEFTGTALSNFINSQRSANLGDNTASFRIEWDACTTCDGFGDVLSLEDNVGSGKTSNKPELYPLGPNAVTLRTFRSADGGGRAANWPLIAGGLLFATLAVGVGIYRWRVSAVQSR